jgi:mono/diheme cytochrome c family protein
MKKTRIAIIALACFAGALFTLPASQATGKKSAPKNVTFNRDVAPIFNANCADCHRPGEAAPFSTLTYKDARPWAKSIREKVANRTMPPWHADPHVGKWANDRSLSQSEIDTIVAWVDQGAKEGDAKDLPPAPKFTEGWSIGKPDVVFTMPEEYALKPGAPDEIQYFEVETNFTEDKYVQMAEARPGNRKIVHHIIAFIQPPPKEPKKELTEEQKKEWQKRREEQMKDSIFYEEGKAIFVKADAPVHDDGCQLPSGGSGSRRDGTGEEEQGRLLAGYAPGMNQAKWEPGTFKRVPAGSKIIFQLHYSNFQSYSGAKGDQTDRSSVGLIFARTQPTRELHTRPVSNSYFKIPAGADNHKVTACWTTKEDIHLITFMPHMHLRGKAQKIEAFYPNGKSEVLLNVPNFDFAWQTVYYAKKPVPIPKGTRIMVTGWFDNSRNNKFNPDPAKDVRWGDPTYTEMMIGWLDYTVDNRAAKNTTAVNNSKSEK